MDEADFLAAVDANPAVTRILDVGASLDLPGWYLTAGGLFQTVWNVRAGLDPEQGIRDYDFFYFDDADLSWDAEDAVIRSAAELLSELNVEVRNQARVHLWYESHFGAPLDAYRSTEDAIDHFVSTTCCFGVRTEPSGARTVYAPHGFDDVWGGVVRPNPVLPMRHVYQAKAARWSAVWPFLTVLPWPDRR